MLIIADTSALIALATCTALDILVALYETVKVPQAVYDEVTVSNKPQANVLAEFLKDRVVAVDTTHFVLTAGGLGQGEIEAMLLYKVLSADYLLIDDRRARAIAESNQIHCIGALAVLLLAKQKGLVSQVAPFVEALRHSPLHYSESLLAKALQLAGE
jgi:predicted nucleic acid-binding protein